MHNYHPQADLHAACNHVYFPRQFSSNALVSCPILSTLAFNTSCPILTLGKLEPWLHTSLGSLKRLEENLHWIPTTTSTHLPVSILTRSTLPCGATPSPSCPYQKPMPGLRSSYLDLTPSCPVREAYSSSSLLSPPSSALYCIIPTSIWICYVLKKKETTHIFPWPISCCLISLFSFAAKLSISRIFPMSTICLLPFSLNSFSSAKEYILCPDPTGDFKNFYFILEGHWFTMLH